MLSEREPTKSRVSVTRLACVIIGIGLIVGVSVGTTRAQSDGHTWHIQVANVQGLYGVDLTVTFDTTDIQVIDAEPDRAGIQIVAGPLFTDRPYFVAYNRITVDEDTELGTVEFVATLLNPAEPIYGDGTVATIPYRLIDPSAPTESHFEIRQAQLAARDGHWLPVEWDGNTIRQVFRLYLPLMRRSASPELPVPPLFRFR